MNIIKCEDYNQNLPVAVSPASLELILLARRIAEHNVPVLITGETGAGKESVAKYIHEQACGADAPFISVNCVAFSEKMLDALLFDHEKESIGVTSKIQQARGGTLLLDEVGDLPLSLQAKLLRILQELEIERQDSHKSLSLNIRLVASTNKDLRREIAEGRFRQDLFYRISVVPIHIKPLRERREDILPLAQHFITKYPARLKRDVHLSDDARTALLDYDWPGNVRELENAIQRGMILGDGSEIKATDLGLLAQPPEVPAVADSGYDTRNAAIYDVKLHGRLAEHQFIIELLKRHHGNKSKTAEFLGITPRALRYRLASMRAVSVENVVTGKTSTEPQNRGQ